MYEWKEYGSSLVISNDQPKIYGQVRLKSGRTIYRNYGRELKNGTGMSLLDILKLKAMNRGLSRSLTRMAA